MKVLATHEISEVAGGFSLSDYNESLFAGAAKGFTLGFEMVTVAALMKFFNIREDYQFGCSNRRFALMMLGIFTVSGALNEVVSDHFLSE